MDATHSIHIRNSNIDSLDLTEAHSYDSSSALNTHP